LSCNKAIFFDRDGTIIREVHQPGNESSFGYVTETKQVELISGSADAIAMARTIGFKTIVITNQSAIARGYITEKELEKINTYMNSLLLKANPNAIIDKLYYCPFFEGGIIEAYSKKHDCRKPDIGMIKLAQKEFNLNLNMSYIIGDSLSDIQCGQNAGLHKILVKTGYGKEAQRKCLEEKLNIELFAEDLLDAVKFIKTNEQK
jgi:D-glycero-D-manno-heptose 1,7-bisphosphate phosphatase